MKKTKKTEKARRLISLALVLVLVLAMFSATALADDTTTGSITMTNPMEGVTYTAYKIFDLTTSTTTTTDDNGEESTSTNYAYTISTSSAWYSYLSANQSTLNITLTATTDSSVYTVTTTDGFSAADFAEKLQDALESGWKDSSGSTQTISATGTTLTAASSDDEDNTSSAVTASGLAYGYYLIVGTSSGTDDDGDTTTVYEGLAELNNVSSTTAVKITDKNWPPYWDGDGKTIVTTDEDGNTTTSTENSVSYGDTVDFQISIITGNYDATTGDTIYKYVITDTLAAGFDFDCSSVQVTITEPSDSDEDDSTTTLTKSETLSSTSFTLSTTNNTDGTTIITITIQWTDDGTYNGNPLYELLSTLQVTYSATLTEDAVIAGDGNKNTASFEYYYGSNGYHGDNDQDEKTTTTYTYAIAIQKVDESGNALAGATFTVKDSDSNLIYAVADTTTDEDGNTTTKDGYYNYAASTDEGATSEFTTTDSGLIVIKGLASGTYTVTETAAPDGYNLATVPKTVEATQTSANSTTITIYYDEDGNVTDTTTSTTTTVTTDVAAAAIVVVNETGSELPKTGGSGTTLLYLVGAVLVIGAGVLLVTKKRMSSHN